MCKSCIKIKATIGKYFSQNAFKESKVNNTHTQLLA